jgi:hypothetical protein
MPTDPAYKVVLRLGAVEGFVLLLTDQNRVNFYPFNNTTSLMELVNSGKIMREFDNLLDGSKYVYGCMRRMPNEQFALLVNDTGKIGWRQGDFTSLRAHLFSTQSAVPAKMLKVDEVKMPLSLLLNNLPVVNPSTAKPTMDLFDQMKDRLKKELPQYGEQEEESSQDTKPMKRPDISTAKDFFTKHKHRAEA